MHLNGMEASTWSLVIEPILPPETAGVGGDLLEGFGRIVVVGFSVSCGDEINPIAVRIPIKMGESF